MVVPTVLTLPNVRPLHDKGAFVQVVRAIQDERRCIHHSHHLPHVEGVAIDRAVEVSIAVLFQ